MIQAIFLIGYEGATVEQFVAALKHAGVDLLIDVREFPQSRKKGFSKNRLPDILRSHGVEYAHLRGLGDPKEGRAAAHAGDYVLFEKIFMAHMQSDAATRDLERAAAMVRSHYACLMCFEIDDRRCHRSIVAEHLARMTGLTIVPLIVHDSANRATA